MIPSITSFVRDVFSEPKQQSKINRFFVTFGAVKYTKHLYL